MHFRRQSLRQLCFGLLVLSPLLPAAANAVERSNDVLLFGTLHGHSSWSIDAYGLGNRSGPDGAYRFARGEEVNDASGEPAQLKLPLDFFMLSDHAEMLGTAPRLTKKGQPGLRYAGCQAGAGWQGDRSFYHDQWRNYIR